MKRKILRSLLIVALVLICFGQAVSAASPAIYFYLPNTGTVYTVCDPSANYKAYLQNPFSVYLSSLDLGGNYGGFGMAFKPLYEKNGSGNGWFSAAGNIWIMSAGSWQRGSYSYADHIYYKLGGRIDSDYSGYCTASGYWNADYVS